MKISLLIVTRTIALVLLICKLQATDASGCHNLPGIDSPINVIHHYFDSVYDIMDPRNKDYSIRLVKHSKSEYNNKERFIFELKLVKKKKKMFIGVMTTKAPEYNIRKFVQSHDFFDIKRFMGMYDMKESDGIYCKDLKQDFYSYKGFDKYLENVMGVMRRTDKRNVALVSKKRKNKVRNVNDLLTYDYVDYKTKASGKTVKSVKKAKKEHKTTSHKTVKHENNSQSFSADERSKLLEILRSKLKSKKKSKKSHSSKTKTIGESKHLHSGNKSDQTKHKGHTTHHHTINNHIHNTHNHSSVNRKDDVKVENVSNRIVQHDNSSQSNSQLSYHNQVQNTDEASKGRSSSMSYEANGGNRVRQHHKGKSSSQSHKSHNETRSNKLTKEERFNMTLLQYIKEQERKKKEKKAESSSSSHKSRHSNNRTHTHNNSHSNRTSNYESSNTSNNSHHNTNIHSNRFSNSNSSQNQSLGRSIIHSNRSANSGSSHNQSHNNSSAHSNKSSSYGSSHNQAHKSNKSKSRLVRQTEYNLKNSKSNQKYYDMKGILYRKNNTRSANYRLKKKQSRAGHYSVSKSNNSRTNQHHKTNRHVGTNNSSSKAYLLNGSGLHGYLGRRYNLSA